MLLRVVLVRRAALDPFTIVLGVQALAWTAVWWLLAARAGRALRAAAVAALLPLLVATAPIYGDGRPGRGRWGSALDAYAQEIGWARGQ